MRIQADPQPNIMKAKKKKIESFKPEDLGLDFVRPYDWTTLPTLISTESPVGDYLCDGPTQEARWW